MHKTLMAIQRGNEGHLGRNWRMAQEDHQTARLDEETPISDLTTAPRQRSPTRAQTGIASDGNRKRNACDNKKSIAYNHNGGLSAE